MLLNKLKEHPLKGTFLSYMRAFTLHFIKEQKWRPLEGGKKDIPVCVGRGHLAKLVKILQDIQPLIHH